jgi:hypothetical protein
MITPKKTTAKEILNQNNANNKCNEGELKVLKPKGNMPLQILTPNHENWGDFVFLKMNSKNSCDNTLKGTAAILWDMQGIDVEGTLEYFKSLGGYCDCEVLLNVVGRYSPDKMEENIQGGKSSR